MLHSRDSTKHERKSINLKIVTEEISRITYKQLTNECVLKTCKHMHSSFIICLALPGSNFHSRLHYLNTLLLTVFHCPLYFQFPCFCCGPMRLYSLHRSQSNAFKISWMSQIAGPCNNLPFPLECKAE